MSVQLVFDASTPEPGAGSAAEQWIDTVWNSE
jgi:hypothetical protein